LVTVRLIDAQNGESIWSDSLDRPEHEIFQIQERITKGIVYALKVPLRMEPQRILVPVRTESMPAYQSYLRARSAALSAAGLISAAGAAEKAMAEDPRFSPAAGLLAANFALYRTLSQESLATARDLGRKTLALDSSSSEAHEALGMALGIGEWDWKAAKLEFERAVQWAPNSPDAHAALAFGYLLPAGDLEGAEYEARKALELDGRSFLANEVLADVMRALGKEEDARTYARAAAEICGDCPRLRRPDTKVLPSFTNIDRAIAVHDPEVAFLQSDPQFAPLRQDQRFAHALTQLKLRE